MENEGKDCPVETIESLTKEAEALKKKLEDERQKLNDVTCRIFFVRENIKYKTIFFSGNCS